MVGIVDERLERDDTRTRGFVLDGFPRTVAQAEALLEITSPRGINVVIDLEVPRDVVLARLASRRVCNDCGTNYSVDLPPKYDMVCDVCGGDVVQRDDDTEKAIAQRLALYDRETEPLIEWFSGKGLLDVVDGTGHPDEVTDRLIRTIDRRREPR
jgi:adenylate kinase